ncbi:unnamed protein product [Strongylus vulgaris]|uniref:Uncharacterized protein n=1 Tax=Strongylus vulgaris TaxID=40348 RepID=A0A3P7LH56_STRVU|nr:unnamed protein product [Strongylus vulgaris]
MPPLQHSLNQSSLKPHNSDQSYAQQFQQQQPLATASAFFRREEIIFEGIREVSQKCVHGVVIYNVPGSLLSYVCSNARLRGMELTLIVMLVHVCIPVERTTNKMLRVSTGSPQEQGCNLAATLNYWLRIADKIKRAVDNVLSALIGDGIHQLNPRNHRRSEVRIEDGKCTTQYTEFIEENEVPHLFAITRNKREEDYDPPSSKRKWKMRKRRPVVENTKRTPIPTPRVLLPCRRDADATHGPRASLRLVQELSQLLAQHMA